MRNSLLFHQKRSVIGLWIPAPFRSVGISHFLRLGVLRWVSTSGDARGSTCSKLSMLSPSCGEVSPGICAGSCLSVFWKSSKKAVAKLWGRDLGVPSSPSLCGVFPTFGGAFPSAHGPIHVHRCCTVTGCKIRLADSQNGLSCWHLSRRAASRIVKKPCCFE
jgi:hypothetical protein